MLTKKMSEWKTLKLQLDEIEKEILADVMKLETSVMHAGVNVKYAKGKRAYDYKALAAAVEASEEVILANTKVTSKVSWKAACTAVGYTDKQLDAVCTQGKPSVSIKYVPVDLGVATPTQGAS